MIQTHMIQITDNYDCYVEYLGKISATLVEKCTTTNIAIVGDFNAAVSTFLKQNY